jgi:hypothetical protein
MGSNASNESNIEILLMIFGITPLTASEMIVDHVLVLEVPGNGDFVDVVRPSDGIFQHVADMTREHIVTLHHTAV